jgi:hypothetical protein
MREVRVVRRETERMEYRLEMTGTEVEPLNDPPAPYVEDVDTKSIRVPVVHPPLPEPVPVASVLADDGPVLPKRPSRWGKFWRFISTW